MKRNIAMAAILIFSFLVLDIKAETEGLEPIDNSSAVIQAVIARQKAYRENDLKALWAQMARKAQEIIGYDNFEKVGSGSKGKERNAALANAKLIGTRFITNNRVWIEAESSGTPGFKGFYLVKENGEWKFTRIAWYVKKVKEDIEFISKAVQDYYRDNKKLPEALSDLLRPTPYINKMPLDPFNDNEAPYVYNIINPASYRIYSFGPDSDDDLRKKAYEAPQRGGLAVSDGDISGRFSVQQ